MPTYHVHLYRELRLSYGHIEAETPEQAAEIARSRPTEQADAIEDCEGRTFAARVDLAGDEGHTRSRRIDFDSGASTAAS